MIKWSELVNGHNRIYKTEFTSPIEMLKVLYDQLFTVEKVADRLGIAKDTVWRYMIMWGIPRRPKGHQRATKFQTAYIELPNKNNMRPKKIAKKIGCSYSYVQMLKNRFG